MALQTTDPEQVKTLVDWFDRWPNARNLKFNPDTREPTIYSRELNADKTRTQVGIIPWKREGDSIVILSNRKSYPAAAITAASTHVDDIYNARSQAVIDATAALQEQEATLLDAWQRYEVSARPVDRRMLRNEVLTAEQALRESEAALFDVLNEGRTVMKQGEFKKIYAPVIPMNRRAIPLAALEP